jgi:hypothetical protein
LDYSIFLENAHKFSFYFTKYNGYIRYFFEFPFIKNSNSLESPFFEGLLHCFITIFYIYHVLEKITKLIVVRLIFTPFFNSFSLLKNAKWKQINKRDVKDFESFKIKEFEN